MSDFINRMATLRWLTLGLLILFSVNSLCTTIVAVMVDATWSDLTGTQKFIRYCLVAGNWTGTLIAFFTNTGKKIQRGETLFDDDPPPDKIKL